MVLRGNKFIHHGGKSYKFVRYVTPEQVEKFKTFEAARTFFFKKRGRQIAMYVSTSQEYSTKRTLTQGQTYLTRKLEF